MNDDQRAQELRSIREEQRILRGQLTRLEERIRALAGEEIAPFRIPEASVPPPILAAEAETVAGPEPFVELPPPLPPPAPSVGEALPPVTAPVTPPSVLVTEPAPPPPPAGPLPEKASLEVEIGTVWLVRIAVPLILTSLAFGGAYLYKHIVPYLGPASKVFFLYLGAGGLTGLGAFLERRQEKEADGEGTPPARHGLGQYARVVLAGGLAAVYYVTYAAYRNPHLCVIPNPFLAGVLLLAWTAFMVFLAHRRNSETLAAFAILLAYYTSAINEIAAFTLFSNLALTGGAVFLLRRHLWKVFPFVSLLATFGSYGFWRYFHVYSAWQGRAEFPSPAGGVGRFWIEGGFLAIYWLLFTWVVFAPGKKALEAAAESTFAGLNNGLFFGLSTWLLLADYPGNFWKWALVFGSVLLALGEAGRRLSVTMDPRTEGTYQAGGILLVAWGTIVYFSGWQLLIALAVQSTALTLAATRRHSRLLLIGAAILAGLTLCGWRYFTHPVFSLETTITSLAGGALLVFNAWWCRRGEVREERRRPAGGSYEPLVQSVRIIFAMAASAVWYLGIMGQVSGVPRIGLVLSLAAAVITALAHGLRLGPLALCAQAYLFVALAGGTGASGIHAPWMGWFQFSSPLIIALCMVAIGHWWQEGCWKKLLLSGNWRWVAAVDAAFAVGVLVIWQRPDVGTRMDLWTAESVAIAAVLFVYGLATRYPALAVAGQYFQLASVVGFAAVCWSGPWRGGVRELLCTAAPVLGAALALLTNEFLRSSVQTPGRSRARMVVAFINEAMIVFLLSAWIHRYVPYLERFSALCLLGGTIFVSGTWRENRRWLAWSGVPLFFALAIFVTRSNTTERAALVHLAGIGIIAAQQQFGRRRAAKEIFPFGAQVALMLAATLTGWSWSSAFILHHSPEGTFTVAVAWSLFALLVFAAGFLWRESTYRWLGLVILGCTLARIILYDIWQLDGLGRIISSFMLGVALLGIAFAYIRFQRQLRRWF